MAMWKFAGGHLGVHPFLILFVGRNTVGIILSTQVESQVIGESLQVPQVWNVVYWNQLVEGRVSAFCGMFTMIYHDLPWFTMIYHDLPWFTMFMLRKFKVKLLHACSEKVRIASRAVAMSLTYASQSLVDGACGGNPGGSWAHGVSLREMICIHGGNP